ncbi:hypothetical protein [Clostridium pasteurianum]|uniref:Uncharacterized protein n=1 Tax=Clostridium pasteurianum BC1 TaxID=86416 RepID=R4K536_CLOPA|nr:hypothetical protein [Clostridium pasteurianum]AGK96821.1 hypothetical protein Clopa_1921 [Clostridium pasteurianum BC1]
MKKMDEMEMSINLNAIKWSHIFTSVSLLVWSVYDFTHTNKPSLAFFILIMSNLIYFFISQISKWKMGDINGRKAIIHYFIGTILIILILGVLAHFFPK